MKSVRAVFCLGFATAFCFAHPAQAVITSDTGYTDVSKDDLEAVQTADDIRLGPATLRYTGTDDVSIPGFTIYNTGLGAGVFAVKEASATVTVGEIVTGAASKTNCLVKLGSGKMVVTGDSSIGGTTGQAGWNTAAKTDENMGAAADGTGPTVNAGALNVNGGTFQVGDATHEPTVAVNGPFVVGGKAYDKTSGLTQTGGTCIMSNGVINVKEAKDMWMGYYGPSYSSGTETHTYFYQYGGTVNLTGTSNASGLLRMGYANGYFLMNGNQYFYLYGGTFNCKGIQNGCNARNGSTYKPYSYLYLYGGELNVDGDVRLTTYKTGTRTYLIGRGGRLNISGTLCLDYKLSGKMNLGSDARFYSGFTLKTPSIVGRQSDGDGSFKYASLLFDGGTWEQPYGQDASLGHFLSKDVFQIDAGGMNVLLTNDVAGVNGANSLTIDAMAAGTGDIVARGPGKLVFGTTFGSSTFTGGIVAKDDATIVLNDTISSKFPVVIGRGGRVSGTAVGSLTLGEAGETTPIVAGTTIPAGFEATTFALGGPVSFEATELGDYPVVTYVNGAADGDLLSLTGPLAETAKASWVCEIDEASGKTLLKIRVAGKKVTQNGTWIGSGTGSWDDPANWQDGVVATDTDATATFAAAGPVEVTVDTARTIGAVDVAAGSVRLSGPAALQVGGNLEGGALTVSDDSALLEVAGPITAGVTPLKLNMVSESEEETVGEILWNATAFAGAEGISPRLSFGFGLLEIGSLGFLTAPADLTIGGGTVAYTGGSAAIPGFTVGATDGRAAIFSVTNAEATVTVTDGIAASGVSATDVHGFIKDGPGALKLLADCAFPGKNASYDAANVGVKANGTGPTAAYYSFNVADGTLEIGDADTAPVVTSANGLSVGMRSRPATEVQTGGSLVMSNGTLTVEANSMLVGYYSGVFQNGSGTRVTNRFTMAGGLVDIKSASLYLGYDAAMDNKALGSYADVFFTVNGGEVRAKQHLNVGNNKTGIYKLADETPVGTRIRMTMNGGLVHLDGDFVAGYANNCSRFDFAGNGGRLEARSVDLDKAARANTGNTRQFYDFNEGFVLQTPLITSTTNQIDVTFNGGVWEQTLANAKLDVADNAYVMPKLTTKGIVIALTNDAAKSYSLAILDPFVNDGNKKGTMTFQGPGFAKFGGGFANSTFTGAFTVKDGATVLSGVDHLQNLNVVIAPGGALRTAEGREVKTASLTLGAAGATAPACIQMMTNASIKVAGDLKVLSPVVFTRAAGKEPDAALSGAAVFDGFAIDAKTMSAYDRSLLRLDPADREAGYGLRVSRTETADGVRLAVSIAERGGMMMIVK